MKTAEVMCEKDKKVETHDIYYAAYLMARGGKLRKAEVTHNGKKRILFELAGDDVLEHAYGYMSGEGVVKMRFLKSALDHLKGIVFEKMNKRSL